MKKRAEGSACSPLSLFFCALLCRLLFTIHPSFLLFDHWSLLDLSLISKLLLTIPPTVFISFFISLFISFAAPRYYNPSLFAAVSLLRLQHTPNKIKGCWTAVKCLNTQCASWSVLSMTPTPNGGVFSKSSLIYLINKGRESWKKTPAQSTHYITNYLQSIQYLEMYVSCL